MPVHNIPQEMKQLFGNAGKNDQETMNQLKEQNHQVPRYVNANPYPYPQNPQYPQEYPNQPPGNREQVYVQQQYGQHQNPQQMHEYINHGSR